MDKSSPVYTTRTECQDCFKCVRNCPAKAIRIKDAHAEVLPELCVACGRCLEVCPAKAKRVRDDLPKVGALLKTELVHASVAPSWRTEFPELDEAGLCEMLRGLGFAGVSETALGAQRVGAAIAETLKSSASNVLISSACPAAKEFVRVHIPDWAQAVSSLPSPLLEHCRIVKESFGPSAKVVFIGPCVAKKLEADMHPELLEAVIGFDDLRRWLAACSLDVDGYRGSKGVGFEIGSSEEGALYAVEGGMIEALCVHKGVPPHASMALSGLLSLKGALTGIAPSSVKGPMLIETLACRGGCVNGPCMRSALAPIERMAMVRRVVKVPEAEVVRKAAAPLECQFEFINEEREPSAEEIEAALHQVGKYAKEDELNCGGCGYDSCRKFARALALGRAESAMCASFMRKLANKKANALIRCMPCGVAIVDSAMKIVECNAKFAEMLGEEAVMAFEARPGLAGANIHKLASFGDLFKEALDNGRELDKAHFRIGDRLFDISIFTIEPRSVVGATVSDVTGSEMKRDQIARQAREVISKNLLAVQDIAWRLGEHMADTEILLRSIADGYSSSAPSDTWRDVKDVRPSNDEAPL